MKVEERIELDIGVIEFTQNIAMGFVNSSINFDKKDCKLFLETCLNHFNHKPFGYISVRQHNYSLNPLIYLQLNKATPLKAFAIVTSSSLSQGIAEIEGKFYKNPFKIFDNLEEALIWTKLQVENSL